MHVVAAPRIVLGTRDDLAPQRIGFNVSQHRQQMLVVLDHRAFKSPPATHARPSGDACGSAGSVTPAGFA